MSELIGRRIGPYEIRDEIGHGGMASVYRAYQSSLNRYVAIKVLATWLAQDTQFVQRFRQEALAAGGLRHPNILGIIDAGTYEGQHFIVMDYVSGGTLSEIMRRGPMPAEQAADLTAQIADALDYAHRRGIVHRDIKPSNILMDEDGRPLLADFGIAQALGSGLHLTQTGASIGTPEYMSPEQSQGTRVDGRSDIYSLGIVLYHMVTGRVPFQATTPVATLYQIVHQPPPPPRTINPSIPPYLESIILRALAKQPDARFATGREMAQALRERRMVATSDAETQLVGAAALPAAVSSATARPATPTPASKTRSGGAGLRILAGLLVLVILALAAGAAYLALGPGDRSAAPPSAQVAVLPSPTVLVSSATPVPDIPTPAARSAESEKPTAPTPPPPTLTAPPPTQTSAVIVATATAQPTSTPAPLATPIPTAPPAVMSSATARPQATMQPTGAPVPVSAAKPGMVLDFEDLGAWKRGDEPYGTLIQVADRKQGGNYSAKLNYQIPQVEKHYVVFMRQPPAAIPGQPTALNMLVYGDGSGHFLNAWVQDSQGEVRQFTFGPIRHIDAWQPMTLSLDTAAPWPQGHISGPNNGKLDYPITFYALVLDAVPRTGASAYSGSVYLDDLAVGEGTAPSALSTPGGAPVSSKVATPVGTSAASAPPAGVAGRIVYTGANGGSTDVYVLNTADTSTRRLFANARQPDIRPDGRVVVNGIGGGKLNNFSINLDGSAETMNGRHPEDSYPHWSPNGGSTVFHSTIGDGKERIYIQQDMSRSEEPTPLTIGGVAAFGRLPIWLSNGRIVFSGCNYWAGGSNCGIWTVNSDGGQPARLTERMDDHATDSSGGVMLYASQVTGNWEVFAVPQNGGAPQNLTNNPGQDTGATFSPDGRSIAFMSNRDGGWGIWIMGADGSNPRKLVAVPDGFGAGWAEESLAWGP